MKNKMSFLLLSLIALTLVACTEKEKEAELTPEKEMETELTLEKEIEAELSLEKDTFQVVEWKPDNSNHEENVGKLTANGQAVVGAVVQISDKRTTETDEKGEFTLTLDANMVEKNTIRVVDLDDATIDGEALSQEEKEKIGQLETVMSVHHPIVIDEVVTNEENSDLVNVHAQAITVEGEKYPKFGVEKFSVAGVIKNEDGTPVEGGTVNLRRDGVEGFTMSDPSNEKGEFAMYYIPEDDENHYFYVYHEGITYTLPPRKTFLFPDENGIELSIILPSEGTVIKDEPPTLVAQTAPGALFKGNLFGLNTDADYLISIPKRDGTFTVTLPKTAWEKNPSFYQIMYRKFHEEAIQPGDILKSSIIPDPVVSEPDEIIPMQNS
ncbi:hypothetical protein [Aquibacillus saliphilus]|uniref:hypothetical protein n=1 Tax=Aquibacillus saliphilus TaxID=1909422 RepID=UPI001CEFE2B6|nr:hypothetical protein [Aquibacillus saliphilus]